MKLGPVPFVRSIGVSWNSEMKLSKSDESGVDFDDLFVGGVEGQHCISPSMRNSDWDSYCLRKPPMVASCIEYVFT